MGVGGQRTSYCLRKKLLKLVESSGHICMDILGPSSDKWKTNLIIHCCLLFLTHLKPHLELPALPEFPVSLYLF
ncbi:hypothetical protein KOW79_020512 [Hemibagrus wyckioides]|uniref:Uncharacterized protein n=1 Tax=Hemibagrus wyckioides TaxID=337641 RepID=A0A9D3N444_9TELE|nr:hypothetical protein KOW79_020512 [Hemibagrus wyckioides]